MATGKYDVKVFLRGKDTQEFKGVSGYRFGPEFLFLMDAEQAEHAFALGDGEGGVTGFIVSPVEESPIVRPCGSGVLPN